MSRFQIRDLDASVELDRAAMQRIYGGAKSPVRTARGLRTDSWRPARRLLLPDGPAAPGAALRE